MSKFTTAFFLVLFSTFSVFSQNTWVKKKSLTGANRYRPVSFSVGGMGYLGTGYGASSFSDFWKYDPLKDKWTQVASITGARHYAVSFVIDDVAYVGGGLTSNQWSSPLASFYKYDAVNDSWSSVANMTVPTLAGLGFASGGKGYVCMGYNGSYICSDLWEYDPATDTWSKKADFPGNARNTGVCFTIGNNTYYGAGIDNNTHYDDFYCYNSDSDTWHQISTFPGGAFEGGHSFVINGKGYIVGGHDGTNAIKTTYEYDPTTDTWTKMKDFGGGNVTYTASFAIGSRGYVGVGWNGSNYFNDMYMYETLARTITADSIGTKNHCGGGSDSIYFTAVNIFDTSNVFTIQMSSDHFNTIYNLGNVKGSNEKQYASFVNFPSNVIPSDSFTFRIVASKPSLVSKAYASYFSIDKKPASQIIALEDSVCDGDSTFITLVQRDPATSLNWYKNNNPLNDTAASITVKAAGTYRLEATTQKGCIGKSQDINFIVNPAPTSSIFTIKTTACEGDSIKLLSAVNSIGDTYMWLNNGSSLIGQNQKEIYGKNSSTYKLVIRNISSCIDTSSETAITIHAAPNAEIFSLKDTSCFGDSIQLTSINNNTGDVYEWWLNGNKITAASSSNFTGRQSGSYTLKMTNSAGCEDLSNPKLLNFIVLNKPSITKSGTILLSSTANSYQWYLNGVILTNETLQTIIPTQSGLYTVTVNNSFGCLATSDPYNIVVNGIAGLNNELNLVVYPNPGQGIITVNCNNVSKVYTIKMINVLGQSVYMNDFHSSNFQINVAPFDQGLYIIQVFEGELLLDQVKFVR